MAIGHFMMAFEPLFLLALFTLILGNGAFKPNISTQVGGLYAPGDHRRDRAYSIFYVGINVGAFLAPLICGTLGECPASAPMRQIGRVEEGRISGSS
jgi:POT family proton-dependent oligopeptide transporter